MERGHIKLTNPERFLGNYEIPREKLNNAIKKATEKLLSKLDAYATGFPSQYTDNYDLYKLGENNNWECGLHTGTILLAYDLTGDERFLDVVKKHMETYRYRFDNKINFKDHDFGFVFSPSTVAYYKRTGDKAARELSLEAAEYFYNVGFCKEGGFIPRYLNFAETRDPDGCRTMMDTLFNSPLFLWAGEETGDSKFTEAGLSQARITRDYLIREDGSSNHHYQFELDTLKPLYGVTLQGNRNDSTWTRGHAWGVYGFPISYDYTKDESLMDVHSDVTAFMLNNLPSDNVLYWDYDFSDGSDEPRDSSATVVGVCGLLEAARLLPENSPKKEIYTNAANMMLEGVIDMFSGDAGRPYDGLIWGVTGARRLDIGLDACATYGDYFYLESLLRITKPEWKRYW